MAGLKCDIASGAGVDKVVRGWLAWVLAMLLVLLVQSASALAPTVELRLDDVYRALGEGDAARAQSLSAALMQQVGDADQQRASVLQARLDVLREYYKLDGAEAQTVQAAIGKFSQHGAHGRGLALRQTIYQMLAGKDVQAALDLAQAPATLAAHRSTEDLAELHYVQAQAATALNGQLDRSRELARVALRDWQALPGLHARWHEVQMYAVVARVYSHTGSKSESLAQFDIASNLAIRFFGADSQLRIFVDMPRAGVLSDLGRYHDAIVVREALLLTARHRYGDNSLEAAKAEGMVGAGLQEIGDYSAARDHYARAETLLTTLTDVPVYERGVIAVNYANLLQEMGDETAALAHYHLALQAFEGEKTVHARAVVLANMGNTEFRLQRYEDAIADFQQALALREQADGRDNPGLSFALEGLGDSALALKRYAEAEPYFRRGLLLRGRALPVNHPTTAALSFGLALALWGQGKIDEAFHYARLTAEGQQSLQASFVADFSERQSVAYRDLLVPATALTVSLAAMRGDAESIATAWHLVMVERGLLARSQALRLAAARSLHDPALAQAWAVWQKANSALAQAWLQTKISTESLAVLRQQIETAEYALWDKAGHHPLADVMTTPAITELAHALPADGLLLAFTEGVSDDPGRILVAGSKSVPEDWYGFSLSANAQPQLRRIGAIEVLSAQTRAWYAALRNPASDIAALHRNGLALRQQLLDPFIGTDPQRSIFVVPEGELFRVSFAALPGKANGYLIETGTRVHTLAHESDLVLPASSTTAITTLLAGAPNFPVATPVTSASKRQLCLRAANQGFAAIPNAARELGDLQKLLSGSDPQSHIEFIAGAAATKENVFAALPKANVIHLATHGFSLDESCSEDHSTRGVSLVGSAASDPASGTNGSSLSGLAFSGASLSEGHSPIGVLSAGELGTLDLSQVDWIALSACDSGLGPISRNEGVFGMRRALRLAGARTVVMSLWQVDDASTADLMQALYRARFVEHHDVPTAMANAMQTVLAARRAANLSDHPFYWAAFIDEGGWR